MSRPLGCPYCGYAIDGGLLASSLRIRCPQCARALRVARRYLTTVAVVVEIAVFAVWVWAREYRGLSLWGLDTSMMLLAGFLLVGLVALFLPRDLLPRRSSDDVITLDLTGDDRTEEETTSRSR